MYPLFFYLPYHFRLLYLVKRKKMILPDQMESRLDAPLVKKGLSTFL